MEKFLLALTTLVGVAACVPDAVTLVNSGVPANE